jgi:hypothetical protein
MLIDRVIISLPDTDGDPSVVKLVGQLEAMLHSAGARLAMTKEQHRQSGSVLLVHQSGKRRSRGLEPSLPNAVDLRSPTRDM